jgi:hypothetical protein
MDGSFAGQLLQGRKICPVTTHFATTILPDWVYSLMTYGRGVPAVRVSLTSGTSGTDNIVRMQRGNGTSVAPGDQLWLLRSDYQLCMEIVNTLPMPLFPSESMKSIMNRIVGALKVKFGGRPGFFPQ